MSTMHEVKTRLGLSMEQWERAKPILFNTEMVREIKVDRKTATRRICKIGLRGGVNIPHDQCVTARVCEDPARTRPCADFFDQVGRYKGSAAPPCYPGDILYVRETWQLWNGVYQYRADIGNSDLPWRPSIHMPKEAARLFLRVTAVRVERLQDITVEDIHSEGWPEYFMPTDDELKKMGTEFVDLWNSTIKPADRARYGWDANPWVWVIEFERISKEEA